MTAITRLLVVLGVVALNGFVAAVHAEGPAGGKGTADGPPLVPLQAVWKFSGDGGKSYTIDSLPLLPTGTVKAPVCGKGEFTIEDPEKIGMLWFTTASPANSGGICPVGERQIGHRYVVMECVLVEAKVSVNGRPFEPEMNDCLALRYGIDPRLLSKGKNVITFSGAAWNSLSNGGGTNQAKVAFQVMTSPADALELRSGPILGPIGEDYFTLACRTHIPAELSVTVKPVEPPGPETSYAVARGTIHHARMPLPKGTRKFQYSITAKNGTNSKPSGPWDVRVPDPAKGLRFVVLGQTATGSGVEGLVKAAESLKKVDPDFILHTGSIVLMAYWDFAWDDCFFKPWKDLLARTPLLFVPAYKDLYSQAYAKLLYYPTADGNWAPWVYKVGPVRFIGIDGYSAPQYDGLAGWIEDQLKAADDKFLFFMTSSPGYTTNPFGRGADGHKYDKTVVQPLLAKYKVTAQLGCTGKYEYIPATNAECVASIITGGVGSPMAPGWLKYQYCIFNIKDGQCSYEAIAYETGEVLDKRTLPPRKQ